MENDLAFHLNNFARETARMKILVYGEEAGAETEQADSLAGAAAVAQENFLAI